MKKLYLTEQKPVFIREASYELFPYIHRNMSEKVLKEIPVNKTKELYDLFTREKFHIFDPVSGKFTPFDPSYYSLSDVFGFLEDRIKAVKDDNFHAQETLPFLEPEDPYRNLILEDEENLELNPGSDQEFGMMKKVV